jgi:hypothetical protein
MPCTYALVNSHLGQVAIYVGCSLSRISRLQARRPTRFKSSAVIEIFASRPFALTPLPCHFCTKYTPRIVVDIVMARPAVFAGIVGFVGAALAGSGFNLSTILGTW